MNDLEIARRCAVEVMNYEVEEFETSFGPALKIKGEHPRLNHWCALCASCSDKIVDKMVEMDYLPFQLEIISEDLAESNFTQYRHHSRRDPNKFRAIALSSLVAVGDDK